MFYIIFEFIFPIFVFFFLLHQANCEFFLLFLSNGVTAFIFCFTEVVLFFFPSLMSHPEPGAKPMKPVGPRPVRPRQPGNQDDLYEALV